VKRVRPLRDNAGQPVGAAASPGVVKPGDDA
jgi:hypothetical protein